MSEGKIDPRLLKPYRPSEWETEIYRRWEAGDFFSPRGDGPVFSLVLPPPNVTGQLHLGHAAMLAIEDILVRYRRMRGARTLWLPGTDHAAIATQAKVEKELQKSEGKTKHDLGREEFLRRVSAFARESHDTIIGPIKKMGCSLDWSREAYTLDETRSRAAKTPSPMTKLFIGKKKLNFIISNTAPSSSARLGRKPSLAINMS